LTNSAPVFPLLYTAVCGIYVFVPLPNSPSSVLNPPMADSLPVLVSTTLSFTRSVNRSTTHLRASLLVKSIGLPFPFHHVTTRGGPSFDARTKYSGFFPVGTASPRFCPRTCSSLEEMLTNGVIQQIAFNPFSRKKVIISFNLEKPSCDVPSNVP